MNILELILFLLFLLVLCWLAGFLTLPATTLILLTAVA